MVLDLGISASRTVLISVCRAHGHWTLPQTPLYPVQVPSSKVNSGGSKGYWTAKVRDILALEKGKCPEANCRASPNGTFWGANPGCIMST